MHEIPPPRNRFDFFLLRFSRAAVPLAYVALGAAYWSAFYQPMPEGRALSPECSNSED